MRRVVMLVALSLGCLGCAPSGRDAPSPSNTPLPDMGTHRPDEQDAPVTRPGITGGETGVPVLPDKDSTGGDTVQGNSSRSDNTAVNQRDRTQATVLPTDQGENELDLQTTAEIRRRIVDLSEISISGRNIKIITRSGQVTLRGPVASREEQQLLERIARDVAGQNNVKNQLEIAGQ